MPPTRPFFPPPFLPTKKVNLVRLVASAAVEAVTDVAITQGGKEGNKEVQGETTTTEEVKGTNKDVEAATSEVKLIKP
jgi:hypothetical protein